MHEIGATDEENYSEQLKVAMSNAEIIPMIRSDGIGIISAFDIATFNCSL